MTDKKLDIFDSLIKESIHEELDQIRIPMDEIEEEWLKLEKKIREKKNNRINKKWFIIAATIIICFGFINLWTFNDTFAGKNSTIKNILTNIGGKLLLKSNSVIEDDRKSETNTNVENLEIDKMSIPLEQAKDIVNFNFKTLPYELIDCVLITLGNDTHVVELNYRMDKGQIRLTQLVEGIDFNQNVSIQEDSNVEYFTKGNMEIAFVKTSPTKIKATWTSFGIRYNLDIKYDIAKDELIQIIQAMN